MIARRYRFHGYNALSYVYKQGRTARSRTCLLKYAANPRRDVCRVAVVVSKKVSKSAVVRNRIRRRMFGQIEDRVGQWPPYDLVFTVLDESIATTSEKNINNIIYDLLQISVTEPVTVDK
jgi:ribonuclease P protein component